MQAEAAAQGHFVMRRRGTKNDGPIVGRGNHRLQESSGANFGMLSCFMFSTSKGYHRSVCLQFLRQLQENPNPPVRSIEQSALVSQKMNAIVSPTVFRCINAASSAPISQLRDRQNLHSRPCFESSQPSSLEDSWFCRPFYQPPSQSF